MRTTIDVDDELLRAVKVHAAEQRMTLKAAMEKALREYLAAHAPPLPVFGGEGVRRNVDLTDNAALRDIMDAEP